DKIGVRMLLAPVIPTPDRQTDKKEAVLVLPAFMEGSRQARPGELPGDNFKRALDHYASGIDSLFGAGGQVIVFNDGSTDKTAEIARSFGVEVLTHEDGMNHGRGRSLSAAFKQLDGRAAMVGYTDADGSY